MSPKTVSARVSGARAQRQGPKARYWFVSYGRDLTAAVHRIKDTMRNEAAKLDVSLARYLVRILDGLGPRGRSEAYGLGALKGGKDDAARGGE